MSKQTKADKQYQADLADHVYMVYLRRQTTEGYAARWLGMNRLDFRTGLSEWLAGLLEAAPVPVEGWERVE